MGEESFFGFYSPNEIWVNEPKEPHNRLVGHNVYIGKINDISFGFNITKNILIGNLEAICKLDVGKFFMNKGNASILDRFYIEQALNYDPDYGHNFYNLSLKENVCDDKRLVFGVETYVDVDGKPYAPFCNFDFVKSVRKYKKDDGELTSFRGFIPSCRPKKFLELFTQLKN